MAQPSHDRVPGLLGQPYLGEDHARSEGYLRGISIGLDGLCNPGPGDGVSLSIENTVDLIVPDQGGTGDTPRDQGQEQTNAQPQMDGQPNAPEAFKRCRDRFPLGPEFGGSNC